MHPYRARLKNGILVEFLPPKNPPTKTKVVIIAKGMPAGPQAGHVIEYFAKKGFWAFTFRYRGTWESEGEFLEHSPEEDVLAILNALPAGIKELWDGEVFQIVPDEVFVVGNSFGGAAAILASMDMRVKKVVTFSPVIDWRVESRQEPLRHVARYLRTGFGPAYRVSRGAWARLRGGKFYNPLSKTDCIDGTKVLIIHAADDTVTPIEPVRKFVKETGAHLIELKEGGHFGSKALIDSKWWKRISAHFRE